MSALVRLECPECGARQDADIPQTVCEACDSPWLARYDLAQVSQTLDREELSKRPAGIWRWSELLPVRRVAYRFHLGEGDTPLLRLDTLAKRLGLENLFLKDESLNPTGTFKARGLAVAISRAVELGLVAFKLPTAGNAGGACAAYAARAGVRAHIYMPEDSPRINQDEVLNAGAELTLVQGRIEQAGRQARENGKTSGWFNLSTFREPYRVEGKKTMGLELAESFGWDLPEVILYPTGGGTGLVGMWKAFEELQALGWISAKRPRMVCVQAAGCAPVVRAFQQGETRVRTWQGAETHAHGLCVSHPYADRLILSAIAQSGGTCVAVEEEAIVDAREELGRSEGILACPEGAATLAGLRELRTQNWVQPDERVVLFNTGSGLKYLT